MFQQASLRRRLHAAVAHHRIFPRHRDWPAILGDGVLSDAFYVALRLPNSFRTIFAEGAFNAAFLPRYAALRRKGEEAAAADFANRVFSWQMAAQIVLLLAALWGMPWIVGAMARRFFACRARPSWRRRCHASPFPI